MFRLNRFICFVISMSNASASTSARTGTTSKRFDVVLSQVANRRLTYAELIGKDGKKQSLLTSKWVEVQRTGTTCAVSPAHLSSINKHRLSTLRRLSAAVDRGKETLLREIPEEPVNQAFTPQIA